MAAMGQGTKSLLDSPLRGGLSTYLITSVRQRMIESTTIHLLPGIGEPNWRKRTSLVRLWRSRNTSRLSRGRFLASRCFSCDQRQLCATRTNLECRVKEWGADAIGWVFGAHSSADGGRRMQWLFAHADERAGKLRGAVRINRCRQPALRSRQAQSANFGPFCEKRPKALNGHGRSKGASRNSVWGRRHSWCNDFRGRFRGAFHPGGSRCATGELHHPSEPSC